MPIDITYDPQSKLLIAKLQGLVSLEEMTQALQRLLESDEIPSDTNALWDVSGMEFNNITIEFQQSLIDIRRQFDEKRGNAKIAILSNYALAEPLVKMYTILSKDLSQVTRMFMLEEEARQWLSEKD